MVTFTQILQIWRELSSALTRGHSSWVNNPLTWAFSERGAHLAAPTMAVVHKVGAKVTQQACSEVMQHCSHPAPRFLHATEHFWIPYFGLGSLEIGFLKENVWKQSAPPDYYCVCLLREHLYAGTGEAIVFLMEQNCSHWWNSRELQLSITSSAVICWICTWFGHSAPRSCSKCTSQSLQ